MASISHLPFFSYAFASLLFLSTLLSLSHASIEQPSSIKCPIPASLEPNSNISLGTLQLSHSEASIEQPSSIKCSIPASLEPNSNISLGIPQLSHPDILPVSEPLPGILDSETLVASTEQQSSIKPPIPASHEPDPDRSSATLSLHSDILHLSEPLPSRESIPYRRLYRFGQRIQGQNRSLGPVPELGICFPWTTFVFHLLLLFLLLQLLQFLLFLPLLFGMLVLVTHLPLGYNNWLLEDKENFQAD
ncbi:uncharacterized protein LOC115976443 [Quercus lobata]|uniref:uncharacterized protein LOC115976443 n=1 Tax=Quercus lobata TaxID=97700 RepID=UPI0012490E26|nr:uncharacterized protein LOC115976443 [Quercus lobata]